MAEGEHKRRKELMKTLAKIDDPAVLDRFFEDLCTPAELSAMADRWHCVQLLEEDLPYRAIYEQTGISTATVTRVARCLTQGRGGYRKALALRKTPKKKE